MTSSEISLVAGVAETMLTEQLLARLPDNLAPAPWTCTCAAVLWTGCATRATAQALPSGIGNGARPLGVMGAMVRYSDTPVGRYDEVLGAVMFRRRLGIRGTVAFMAVDSETSLVGGRANWAMPKTLARFDGEVVAGGTMTARGALDTPWSIAASAKPIGPALPIVSSMVVLQQFAEGDVRSSKLHAKGRVRPAVVSVDVDDKASLSTWLRSGRHLGGIVESMTFTLDEPRPVRVG
ncbi:MAG: acetoacetate decarboxylase family protein [Aldersonia sp.]|nr:acetoacetate decarboxylase family protein [Aldersonia sp.]